MAKKKKAVIDLSAQKHTFLLDEQEARIISFDPNTMTLSLNLYADGKQVGSDPKFPFAHLPKPLKKIIKPL